MVKFVKVDPRDISDMKPTARGRVSYPILKGFLETGMYLAMLDRTGMQQSLQTLQLILRNYAKNHKMPIKVFTRQKQVYLMRLDINEDGSQNEDWDPEMGDLKNRENATPITAKEVSKRFKEEKDKVTK